MPVTSPFVRTFDVLDRLTKQVLPDGSQETQSYDYKVIPDPKHVYSAGPLVVAHLTSTDPLGKKTEYWADVGDAVYLKETPAAPNNPDGSAGPLAGLPSAARSSPRRGSRRRPGPPARSARTSSTTGSGG